MPREGHDLLPSPHMCARGEISIHVPREGHDLSGSEFYASAMVFQSTCPARGTTGKRCVTQMYWIPISIHVPREGHDYRAQKRFHFLCNFNPRAPRGARRTATRRIYRSRFISIHVPREGHDYGRYNGGSGRNISIHVPREGHDECNSRFIPAL